MVAAVLERRGGALLIECQQRMKESRIEVETNNDQSATSPGKQRSRGAQWSVFFCRAFPLSPAPRPAPATSLHSCTYDLTWGPTWFHADFGFKAFVGALNTSFLPLSFLHSWIFVLEVCLNCQVSYHWHYPQVDLPYDRCVRRAPL